MVIRTGFEATTKQYASVIRFRTHFITSHSQRENDLKNRQYEQTTKGLTCIYGRRGNYVSISKQTSLKNFVRSSALLRSKFGVTSFEVRRYFV